MKEATRSIIILLLAILLILAPPTLIYSGFSVLYEEKGDVCMTLKDLLLSCGNLKNRSLVIITDEHGEVYSNTVEGIFEQNPEYMKKEVAFFKIFYCKNGDKIICLI